MKILAQVSTFGLPLVGPDPMIQNSVFVPKISQNRPILPYRAKLLKAKNFLNWEFNKKTKRKDKNPLPLKQDVITSFFL